MKSKHEKKFIHNCEKCTCGANKKQSMQSHVIREHISKEDAEQLEKFSCSTCKKEFVATQLLQKHLYSGKCTLVEKNYECIRSSMTQVKFHC